MYTDNGTQRSVAQRSTAAWEFSTVPPFAVRLIDVLIKLSEMMEMVTARSIAPLHYPQSQTYPPCHSVLVVALRIGSGTETMLRCVTFSTAGRDCLLRRRRDFL